MHCHSRQLIHCYSLLPGRVFSDPSNFSKVYIVPSLSSSFSVWIETSTTDSRLMHAEMTLLLLYILVWVWVWVWVTLFNFEIIHFLCARSNLHGMGSQLWKRGRCDRCKGLHTSHGMKSMQWALNIKWQNSIPQILLQELGMAKKKWSGGK